MSVYQAGDLVTVRPDLHEIEYGNYTEYSASCFATPEMVAMAGMTVTIDRVVPGITKDSYRYRVIEDPYNWSWTDDMFVGLASDEDNTQIAPFTLNGFLNLTEAE